MAKPDFLIIGAQKSASSALTRALSGHPQLYLPKAETRYFRDPWYELQSATVLEEAVSGAKPGVLRRGIKCPDLLASADAPDRIRRHLDDPALIAVLREPVARAISAYFWYVQWGWLPIASVDEGLERLLDGSYQADYPRSVEVLDYGHYPEQLQRFRDVFGADRMHVLLTEDLSSDPATVVASTYRFLGVDDGVRVGVSGRRVNQGVYSERRLRLLRLRHRHIMRSFPGYPGTYVQSPGTPQGWVIDRSVAALDRLVLARILDNTPPPVSPAVQARLADYYRADVIALESLLGRSLPSWRA